MNTMRKLRAYLFPALTALAFAGLAVVTSWAVTATASPVASLPACASEDDTRDCYWDANRRGNQTGSSFVHYGGRYYYLDT